jgi:hypothetical protein
VQFPGWLEDLSVSELDEKTSWWACSWCLAFADYRAPKKRQECRFYVNILKFTLLTKRQELEKGGGRGGCARMLGILLSS